MKIKDRKLDHLKICAEKEVEAGSTGLGEVSLRHMALPEIDFDEIDMGVTFLGKKLDYPVIIEAMTGGVEHAAKINRDVAEVAQKYRIGMGVGSQRAAIENPALASTFKVRDVAPDIMLIGNLGAVQLNYGYSLKECRAAIDMIGADALALHLNPLQEAVQPEGNRNFSGLAAKINKIASGLGKPVIVKETGCGISLETAEMLKVSAFDVAGSGGTSWSLVESYRMRGRYKDIGVWFSGWGIPTSDSVRQLAQLKVPLIASGGIRTGQGAAKALALGADCVGLALPILRAWEDEGKRGVKDYLDVFLYELRIAMFLTGSLTPAELKGKIKR